MAVLAVIAVSVVYFWSRILAWQRYGDVTPEIQMEIIQRSLASGVSVQFANGALAVVKTKDVKAIRDGFCERSFACNLPVRRSDCLRMGVYFSCSHAMDLADGRTARSLVNFHAMMGVLPKLSRVKASEFIRDGTEPQVVRNFMCVHKFHCTKSLPIMRGFPHDSRAFRDCKNGFCAPEMITLPTGRYRRGTTPEEAKQLFADFGGFADLYDNEMPALEVTLSKRIALGRFEVTVADWQACELTRPALQNRWRI